MCILIIPNISCGHCARTITDVIMDLDPLASVEVDIARHTAKVGSTVDLALISARLTANGYPPTNA